MNKLIMDRVEQAMVIMDDHSTILKHIGRMKLLGCKIDIDLPQWFKIVKYGDMK